MISIKKSELADRASVSLRVKLKQWLTLGFAGMAFNLFLNLFFYEERGWAAAFINSLVTLVFVVILSFTADLILRKWLRKN